MLVQNREWFVCLVAATLPAYLLTGVAYKSKKMALHWRASGRAMLPANHRCLTEGANVKWKKASETNKAALSLKRATSSKLRCSTFTFDPKRSRCIYPGSLGLCGLVIIVCTGGLIYETWRGAKAREIMLVRAGVRMEALQQSLPADRYQDEVNDLAMDRVKDKAN